VSGADKYKRHYTIIEKLLEQGQGIEQICAGLEPRDPGVDEDGDIVYSEEDFIDVDADINQPF